MKLTDPIGKSCPYRGTDCVGVSCPLYVVIRGIDAQGDEIDQGVCAPAAQLAYTVDLSRRLDGIQKVNEQQRNLSDAFNQALLPRLR